MKTTGSRGIHLEQNKKPALLKELKRIGFEHIIEQKIPMTPTNQPLRLAPYEIAKIAQIANIVDESDGKMLWNKLTNAVKDGVSILLVDAIDDEPYISSQLVTLLQNKEEVALGIRLAARAVGAKDIAIEVYKDLFDVEIEIPEDIDGIRIARVSGTYPVEYRARKLQKKSKALAVGVCSLLHLYRAVCLAVPQQSCFITVAGDCVVNPGNYEVPIGTSILRVLEMVGTLSDPKLLVAGGSMTGYSVIEPERVPIAATTRGVLAFATSFRDNNYTCIGCGRCTEVCPEGLSPFFIHQVMASPWHRGIHICDAHLCTGCGTCSYVCPAKLDLSQIVQECAKLIYQSGKGE